MIDDCLWRAFYLSKHAFPMVMAVHFPHTTYIPSGNVLRSSADKCLIVYNTGYFIQFATTLTPLPPTPPQPAPKGLS